MKNYCPNCMRAVREIGVCPHCGFDTARTVTPPHILRPGTLLNNRYLLGNPLGQGGFGITYIGLDRTLQMRVAVKEYFPAAYANRNAEISGCVTVTTTQAKSRMEEGKAKFLQEARILAKFCGTPGIVGALDFFEANDTAYIVMEYLEGLDLRRYLRNHGMSAEEAFSLMLPVMDSLEKIHAEHIIHRDISPDNVMRLKDGSLKLMDFGAARIVDYSSQKSVSVMLKAGYAPPEQYRSKGTLGPWTDIYGLCATLYKCITGVTPDDALERSDSDRTRWPSEMGLPITLLQENVLKKGLALRYQERFQSIGELRRTLNGPQTVQNIVIDTEDVTVYHKHRSKNAQTGEKRASAHPAVVARKEGASSRKAFFAALVIAVILCLTAGGFLFRNKGLESGENNYQKLLAALHSQAETNGMDLTDVYHVTLQSDVDIPIDELSSAYQTIQDRLDILTDGRPYAMKTNQSRIDLLLPKDAFIETDSAQDTLDFFIGNRFNPLILDSLWLLENNQRWNMPIRRKDFQRVMIQYGSIEGIDPSEYGIQTEQYHYLELAFTPKFAEELAAEITMKGNEFEIWIMSQGYGATLSIDKWSEDGQTGYVLFEDSFEEYEKRENYLKLWEYNLSHDSLDYYFNCIIDIDYRTEWESMESIQSAGENQCDIGDFSEGTVSFTLSVDEDKSDETLVILKRRMDALNTPYAIGRFSEHTDEYLVVKTLLNHMGVPFLRLLTSKIYDCCLSTYLSERTYLQNYSVSLVTDNPSAYGIRFQFKNPEEVRGLRELSQILTNQGGGKLYLTSSGYICFSADINRVITDGSVIFTKHYFSQEETLTTDTLWIFELFNQICNGLQYDASLSVKDYQFYPGQDGRLPTKADFGVFNPMEQEIQEAIRNINSDAKISQFNDYYVGIQLNLAVDEKLPDEGVACVKQICQAYDFEHSPFEEINFRLSQRNPQWLEHSNISLCKHLGRSGEEDGCMYLSCSFQGGRMNRYRERMKEIVETDPFFVGLTVPEYSEWNFGV